ncbi:undecaprenyl-diphosphatase [Bartonella sp. CB178]|uniref:undecaprenyl-diphosphatase n=1 Tax=Bartonella sp. CB178 TaxID=3112255 RepID=UPI00300E588E
MDFIGHVDTELFGVLARNSQSREVFAFFGIFCAKFLIYIIPIHLCLLWFCGGNTERRTTLSICVSICAALFIGYLISFFYFRPRPFISGLALPLIEHRATASFPSNHALTVVSYAAGLYFYRYRVTFRFAAVFLCLICWARVYVGVHYPLDVLAGVILGSFVSWGVIRFLVPHFPEFLYQIPPLKYNFKVDIRFK